MKSGLGMVVGLACVLVVLHAPATSQVSQPEPYLDRLRRAEAAVPPLPADADSDEPSNETRGALAKAARALPILGTARSWVGDTDGAIAAFDMRDNARPGRGSATSEDLGTIEDAAVEDAVQAIVGLARTKRVVMINEAHHVPMHRAFGQKLAIELRKIGYTYLAAETFSDNSGFKQPGYVDWTFGYYTSDPVFAGFVNNAIADGWKLVSYEHSTFGMTGTPTENLAARETGQAKNLVDRIFAKDKDAKVLIFVGHGHLWKTAPAGAVAQMGEHLRNMTKLDTLHVDQTYFYAHLRRSAESPLYAAMLAKSRDNVPFVLRSKNGSYPVFHGMQGRVDMQVIFPRYSVRHGRPEWLETLAGRTPLDIPAQLIPRSGRRLVQAYRASDGPGAVPADNVLVEAGKPVPKLMVPNGEIRVAHED